MPDEGYQMGKVTVNRPNGEKVTVTKKSDGIYTFTMPNGIVTVDVAFVSEGQWENPFVDVADDSYYFDAVRWAEGNDSTSGATETTFSPNNAVLGRKSRHSCSATGHKF